METNICSSHVSCGLCQQETKANRWDDEKYLHTVNSLEEEARHVACVNLPVVVYEVLFIDISWYGDKAHTEVMKIHLMQ